MVRGLFGVRWALLDWRSGGLPRRRRRWCWGPGVADGLDGAQALVGSCRVSRSWKGKRPSSGTGGDQQYGIRGEFGPGCSGGCGRIGGTKPDRELLDAFVRGSGGEGSVYRFLAEHRLRLFGDGLFADLFGGRGRPSVPGSVIAVVMVLQAFCSDREAVERLRCDVRWKAAAGRIDDEGFPSVLTLASEAARQFVGSSTRLVECGGFKEDAAGVGLHGTACGTGHGPMIGAQIRRVRKPAGGQCWPVTTTAAPSRCVTRPRRAGLASGQRRPGGARRACGLRAQRRAGPGGGAFGGGGRPRRRGRPQGAGTVAHSAPCREGPGIDSGPRGPPRPQVPLAAPRRLQGPHLRRARHRAHHRSRTHHRDTSDAQSAPACSNRAPHNTDTADTADTDTADTDRHRRHRHRHRRHRHRHRYRRHGDY